MKLKNQSRIAYGTKILNQKTNEIGLLIYTWDNRFAINGGGYEDICYATCVDINGKKYNIPLDFIKPLED